MKINNLSAIVYRLRNGEDNAGISREALADYLESVDASLKRLQAMAAEGITERDIAETAPDY